MLLYFIEMATTAGTDTKATQVNGVVMLNLGYRVIPEIWDEFDLQISEFSISFVPITFLDWRHQLQVKHLEGNA